MSRALAFPSGKIKQKQLFFFFFLKCKECSILQLKMVPKIFVPILQAVKISCFKRFGVFCFSSTCPDPDPATGRGISSRPPCCSWVTSPPSLLACWNDLHAAFMLHDTCPAGLQSAIPHNDQPSASTVLLPPSKWKIRATSSWDQRRKSVAVFNHPKCRGKFACPLQREREREWGGSVGEAWITRSVAQTTGSLW